MQYTAQTASFLTGRKLATDEQARSWAETGTIPDSYAKHLVTVARPAKKVASLKPRKVDPLLEMMAAEPIKRRTLSRSLSYPDLMDNIMRSYLKPDTARPRALDIHTKHKIIDELTTLVESFDRVPRNMNDQATADALRRFLGNDLISTNGLLKKELNATDCLYWAKFCADARKNVPPDLLALVYDAVRRFVERVKLAINYQPTKTQ